MRKKLLSILLTLALLLSLVPAAFAGDIEIVDEPEEDLIPIVEEEGDVPQPAEPQGDSSVVYRALLVGEVSFSFETARRNQGDTELISDMLANTLGPEGNQYLVTTALDLSGEGILNKIGSTFAGADDNDVSLFFIATHGVVDVETGPYAGELLTIEEPGSRDGYLLLEDLADCLKAVPGKIIVVLGSCGSGAAIVSNGAPGNEDLCFTEAVVRCFEDADEYIPEPGADEPQTGEFRNNKFCVLTAAAHQESSWGQEGSTPFNFFPYYFALGANTGMPADSSKDGLVTLDEMYQYCLENAYGPYYDGTDYYYQHAQVYPENSSYPLFRESELSASGQCGDDLYWTLDDEGTLTITGTGEMWDYGMEKQPGWSESADSICALVIEDGATSIGDYAFRFCSNMLDVTIPETMERIERFSFSSCRRMTSLTLPDGLIGIGEGAFNDCSSLTIIEIPESVMSIGESAFRYCGNLLFITIPKGVTSIEDYTFYNCGMLRSVSMPNGLKSIGVHAFEACYNLTSVIIPSSVTSFEAFAFSNCSKLAEIRFEGAAPTFADNCFSGVTATAYYPANDPSWTESVMQNYGGDITWVPYGETIDGLPIDEEHFPDENFRAYVAENFDADENGYLNDEEIDDINEIYVSMLGITSLQGIEYFPELTWLECLDNALTELDLSHNEKLESLDCSFNSLTALDVTKNPALVMIDCSENAITALDVTQNPVLAGMFCYSNEIAALDLSGNPALLVLDCSMNELTALKLAKNPGLLDLSCYGNHIAELDLTPCPTLLDIVTNGTYEQKADYDSYTKDSYFVHVDPATKLITEPSGDGYTVTVTDWTKGKATTSLVADEKYSGTVDFTVNADQAVLVALKNGDEYTLLKCTTNEAGEHHFTLEVNGDTEIAIAFRGDANLNGKLETRDATLVCQVKTGNYGNGLNRLAADVNNNGKVETRDATLLCQARSGNYNIPW